MKLATALLRKGVIHIQGYSQTHSGVWIASGRVRSLDQAADSKQIAIAIREAFAASTRGVPHPRQDEWPSVQAPMLEAAGVKNWATLARGAKAVGLELDGSVVTMTPSANYARQGGEELPDQTIRSELESDALGSDLVQAFKTCS